MKIQQYLLPSISSRYTFCGSVAMRLCSALQPILYQRMFMATIHVELPHSKLSHISVCQRDKVLQVQRMNVLNQSVGLLKCDCSVRHVKGL